MTTKNKDGSVTIEPNSALAQTADERATQRAASDVLLLQQTELERLVAERKALNEQIKQAKAAEKAARTQRKEQTSANAIRALLPRVARRIEAGQSQDSALDAEWALLRAALVAKLAANASSADTTDQQNGKH